MQVTPANANAVQIRPAEQDDIAAIVMLLGEKRARLAGYEPAMWRPAPEAAKVSEAFLTFLLQQPTTLAFVAHDGGAMRGFIIGLLQTAPPVYAPGGSTCLVDDFAVQDNEAGERAAAPLLQRVWDEAKQRGAAQTLVVTAEKDLRIGGVLRGEGLRPASVWWTKTL